MYCPHCGVNNDRGEASCFICHKPLPPSEAAGQTATRGRSQRQGSVETQPGSVGDRMIALIFDRLVVASVLLVLAAWARTTGESLPSGRDGAAVSVAIAAATVFLYHFLCESILLTTIGKAAMGLRLAVEGGRGRLTAVAVRNLLRPLDALGLYLVGFLFATFSLRRQRIGDRAGGTLVVEWPVGRGARAAVMFLLAAIAAAAVWIAAVICPACPAELAHRWG